MFIDFSNGGSPDDLHQARITALLGKWLHGSRLSRDERAEIAHVLPDGPQGKRAYTGSPEENAERIGLSRRPFFRWQNYGRAHNDPLPCHDPPLVPAWYDRMKARGVFKHRCPREVLEACKVSPVVSSSNVKTNHTSNGSSGGTINDFINRQSENHGIAAEIDALQRRVASLREASDAAYLRNDNDTGDQLRDRHQAELEKLRKLKKDAPKLLADDEENTRKAWVAEDLGGIIQPMIATWMAEGSVFHRESQSALPRAEFLKLWRAVVAKVCRSLAQSRFAPPLQLEAIP